MKKIVIIIFCLLSFLQASSQKNDLLQFSRTETKCTACDFTANNGEGILSNDGLMMWNEKYAKRMQHRYGNDFCRKCRIFLLCHGGCSQHKLNTLHIKNQCIRNYDELYIQKIIEDRVEYLLDKLTQIK